MSEDWTPGPWGTVINACKTDWMVYAQDESDFHRGYVATTAMTNEQSEANANLIAAAPELYHSLRDLVARVYVGAQLPGKEWLENATAALAKARGVI
jgi:hypothetical protein